MAVLDCGTKKFNLAIQLIFVKYTKKAGQMGVHCFSDR